MGLHWPNISFDEGDMLVIDGNKYKCHGRASGNSFDFDDGITGVTREIHIDELYELLNESTHVTIIRRE